jgi:GNAT superfamily N-acetyltransferase
MQALGVCSSARRSADGGRSMSTEYVVRLAGPEHVDQLPDIERAAATRFGDSLPKSVLTHVTPVDNLVAAQQAGLLWVALEPAGIPVGFAVASMCGPRMHLDELDVLPEHGRKGIGSALLEAVEDYALKSDCTEIALTTFRDVPWNAPFYARVGFEVIPEQELDAELVRRLADEAALGLDRSRRVAMRLRLSRPTRASTMTR